MTELTRRVIFVNGPLAGRVLQVWGDTYRCEVEPEPPWNLPNPLTHTMRPPVYLEYKVAKFLYRGAAYWVAHVFDLPNDDVVCCALQAQPNAILAKSPNHPSPPAPPKPANMLAIK